MNLMNAVFLNDVGLVSHYLRMHAQTLSNEQMAAARSVAQNLGYLEVLDLL